MKQPPAAPADDAADANVSIESIFLNFAVAEANMVATDALVTSSICGPWQWVHEHIAKGLDLFHCVFAKLLICKLFFEISAPLLNSHVIRQKSIHTADRA